MTIQIRTAGTGDFDAVKRVISAAFAQTDEARLVDMLRATGDARIDFVATDKGVILGHVMFSEMRRPENWLGLAPIAVAPERQRSGVGAALIQAGLEQAGRESWGGVIVLGEPAYYERFGFSVEAAARFDSDYPSEYLMALELRKGALAKSGGVARYARAFGAS